MPGSRDYGRVGRDGRDGVRLRRAYSGAAATRSRRVLAQADQPSRLPEENVGAAAVIGSEKWLAAGVCADRTPASSARTGCAPIAAIMLSFRVIEALAWTVRSPPSNLDDYAEAGGPDTVPRLFLGPRRNGVMSASRPCLPGAAR